jgi:hypothetical protein
MMQAMTLSALKSSQFEIREEARDTPLPNVGTRWGYRIVRGFAATTEILNPSHSVLNDYVLISRNITGASEEEVVPETEPEPSREETSSREASPSPIGDTEIANRDRLELLARAYVAGKLSPEEDARLAIVTERVRRLIPRVTVDDVEQLERVAEDVRRIEAEDTERRLRLGFL